MGRLPALYAIADAQTKGAERDWCGLENERWSLVKNSKKEVSGYSMLALGVWMPIVRS